MPCFKLLTNLSKNKIPSDFTKKITPLLAEVLRKPAQNFICLVSVDCHISFGDDSNSPGAVATLESIGNLGPNENKIISKEVSTFVEKELGIKPERFFLSFYDIAAYNIGKGGSTLA